MRHSDQFGYDLEVKAPKVATAWNETVLAFLAHGRETPIHLAQALEADPHFAMGHASRGLFCLLLGRPELLQTARESLVLARRGLIEAGGSFREEALVGALEDWLQGWPSRSVHRLDAALVKYPRDTFLMKLVHAIRFILGDAKGMRLSIEQVKDHYDLSHPGYGFLLGCHAFALEETGAFRQAEDTGRKGLDLQGNDAWGLHAVAHVHDMTGRAEEGITWLSAQPESWSHCNNFGYHVWWHLALMHLDRGDIAKVFQLYDDEIRRDRTDDYRDISNATSLLARLELEGINVGNRWEELAQLSDKRAEDGCNVFADLHYLLALLNGGRRMGTERLLTSMAQHRAAEGDIGRVSEHPGLATAQGLEQFKKGNYASAFHLLAKARDTLPTIGGSHAQRDVFERITVDAALRAGMPEGAEKLLKDRARKRGGMDTFAETRLATVERMRKASTIMLSQDLRATPA